jgi:TetR/AcrR family transcriptional regulator, transcriptional repressor for nem operon
MADTRERLLEAAMRLFWEKGYNSTSIADILREAGANSGSLYHFFPTKQDLLVAVLDRYLAGIKPMLLEPAWRGVDDPIERVFALLARYRELLDGTDCFYGCPIGYLALELHEPDPPVRAKLAANFAAWSQAVRACLDAAADRLPAEVDRGELAEFVLTTMEGGVMLARTHRTLAPFDASVARLRDYVERLEAAARGPADANASGGGKPDRKENAR